ncbi:hypothetical protein [Chenggangzhangella methanolivorans]|uniref:Uncharacterized protein n=1 Tax=Chenggangzhangella methanolivorans TaxID=1437009 RepID=A0A9E6R9Q7_9HYPH|nr:hypothetical protein [Chenggangzhangella methanolivorans]QZN99894.1 hypothetical protein K6K41_25200 [Chenggangzhangella methanolivorans]
MKTSAQIAIGIACAFGALLAFGILDIKPSGPTLEQAAEAERAEQRAQNAEICRLARDRLSRLKAEDDGAKQEREDDEHVVRVKCAPLGL